MTSALNCHAQLLYSSKFGDKYAVFSGRIYGSKFGYPVSAVLEGEGPGEILKNG